MRQSREAKAATHQTVIKSASRLFRQNGIERTSVGDVMQAADKTHGGFYRHFDSKESLLVAAVEDAFADMVALMQAGLARSGGGRPLARFTDYYLSPEMVGNVGGGCPAAALSGDVLRSTDAVRQAFGAGVSAMLEALAATLEGPEEDRLRRATETFCTAAGALMIARASDPATAARLIGAIRPERPATRD